MLQLQGLSRRFGEIVAVDQVGFTVRSGELVGFVGGNGAGKTTTMRMLMGLLDPHAGEVLWHGRPVTAADRRTFGYMPEERGLYPKQPILDQLVYLAQLKGMGTAEARSSVLAALERFGLADRAKERAEKLSLGNHQRVQIIASLLAGPQALILDEPFSGLDPAAVDTMVGLLREYNRDGLPILFSSHQLDLVEQLCDRVVVLARGRVVADGTVEELRRSGPIRHRLRLSCDAGWVRDLPGVLVADIEGHHALVEITAEGAARDLIAEALRRGEILEFAPVVPRLSEIYREVTA